MLSAAFGAQSFKELPAFCRPRGTVKSKKLPLFGRKILYSLAEIPVLAPYRRFRRLTGIAKTERIGTIRMKTKQIIHGSAIEIGKAHQIKNNGHGFSGFVIRVGGTLNAQNIGYMIL